MLHSRILHAPEPVCAQYGTPGAQTRVCGAPPRHHRVRAQEPCQLRIIVARIGEQQAAVVAALHPGTRTSPVMTTGCELLLCTAPAHPTMVQYRECPVESLYLTRLFRTEIEPLGNPGLVERDGERAARDARHPACGMAATPVLAP